MLCSEKSLHRAHRESATSSVTRRRSRIIPDEGDMSLEDLIADEELVVTITSAGYVKAVLSAAYRTQGRGGRGVRGAQLREDDVITHVLHTSAHAYLLFFTNQGKVYRVRAHQLPRMDRTAKGSLVQSVLSMDPDERVEAIIDTRDYETHPFLVMFTKMGQVKKTKFSDYDSRNACSSPSSCRKATKWLRCGDRRRRRPGDVHPERPRDPLRERRRTADGPRHAGRAGRQAT